MLEVFLRCEWNVMQTVVVLLLRFIQRVLKFFYINTSFSFNVTQNCYFYLPHADSKSACRGKSSFPRSMWSNYKSQQRTYCVYEQFSTNYRQPWWSLIYTFKALSTPPTSRRLSAGMPRLFFQARSCYSYTLLWKQVTYAISGDSLAFCGDSAKQTEPRLSNGRPLQPVQH